MSLVILKREARYGLLRMLYVIVDSKQRVSLKYGEEKEIKLSNGNHLIEVKMSWTKSLPMPISIDSDVTRRIVIRNLPLIEASIKAYIPPFAIFTLEEVT